jgi:hypothetical protein
MASSHSSSTSAIRISSHSMSGSVNHQAELGRQAYDMHKAHSERQRAKWKRWSAYTGRRVDLSVRALPIPADAPISSVISALQEWLAHGAQNTAARKPSAWHLAKKAAVLIYPDSHRGYVVWPPVGRDHHQPDVPTP